jgi:hypothetical protein
MILGWGIRLKYQQSLKVVRQNECVSYWLLLTVMTRRYREQAMSRGVSEETPELRSFSTDLLCEAIWKKIVGSIFEVVHDSDKEKNN